MNFKDIRNIERPIDDFDVGTLECDLVWSDPDVDAKTEKTKAVPFRPNFDREPVNGIGQLFNAESVKRVCKQLHIDMVIRGHQVIFSLLFLVFDLQNCVSIDTATWVRVLCGRPHDHVVFGAWLQGHHQCRRKHGGGH